LEGDVDNYHMEYMELKK